MEEEEIMKRLPEKLIEMGQSFEMKAIAIWVTATETEIYFCEENPTEETLSKIEQLSQSILG